MADRKIVIVGGGAIGSAIAFFTLSDPAFKGAVTVIERDPAYARASSALSASSIRQQFSTAINIELSRFGIDFLRRAGDALEVGGERPDIGLAEPGYLFLASPLGVDALRKLHTLHKSLGADTVLLDPAALGRRFPWLSCDDIALGSLGLSGEGWFDGYSLLQAFRKKARSLGATYFHAEACGFDTAGDRITHVKLVDGTSVACDLVVNAAGPWAREPAAWLGLDLPVRPRRRCVFVFRCPTHIEGAPLVIDPCGVYFRPEGRDQFICGTSPGPDEDPDDLPLDVDHSLFETEIWPRLAKRVPAFESLRQTSAWAGYYEFNTFDQNGIVGLHPACPNFMLANGFSGHGLQHSPGVGRAVAELIVYGRYRTLDLSALSFARIAENRPLIEQSVV